MRELTVLVYSEHIDKAKWKVVIAPSSLSIWSPGRKYCLKIDCACNFILEVRKGIECKSNTFRCQTPEEAWKMAFRALRTYEAHI